MSKKQNPPNFQLHFPDLALTMDAPAFDNLIRSQGVNLVHYKAMRCPVGIADPDDNLRPHEHHVDCHNGWLLKKIGEVTAVFQGNTHSTDLIDVGRMENAVAQITLPRFYDDKPDKRVAIMPFDRFYYADEVTNEETVQCFKLGPTGKDKLLFEAVSGVFLVDSKGKEYGPADYQVAGGYLTWNGNSWPGEGISVSIRYVYRTYWVVSNLVHDIRTVQQIGPDGRYSERMSQTAVVQREFFFRDTENDSENPRIIRQEIQPKDNYGELE